MTNTFTAIIIPAEEGGFIAYAAELPGANTQGETIEEARENLKEAIELILETNRELAQADLPNAVATEAITVGDE